MLEFFKVSGGCIAENSMLIKHDVNLYTFCAVTVTV